MGLSFSDKALATTFTILLVAACAEGADSIDLEEGSGTTDRTRDGSALPDSQRPLPDGSTTSPDGNTTPDSSTPDAPVTTACAEALAAASFNFESSAAGWTHGVMDGVNASEWPYDPWQWGVATNDTDCSSGKCFGAPLDENYAQCQRAYLMSPSIDLSACTGREIVLAFDHAYAFWKDGTYFDGGVVQVSSDDGATWTVPPGTYPGTLNLLKHNDAIQCSLLRAYEIDKLKGFTGRNSAPPRFESTLPASFSTAKMRIRFAVAGGASSTNLNADGSRVSTGFGWRIDNIALTAK